MRYVLAATISASVSAPVEAAAGRPAIAKIDLPLTAVYEDSVREVHVTFPTVDPATHNAPSEIHAVQVLDGAANHRPEDIVNLANPKAVISAVNLSNTTVAIAIPGLVPGSCEIAVVAGYAD